MVRVLVVAVLLMSSSSKVEIPFYLLQSNSTQDTLDTIPLSPPPPPAPASSKLFQEHIEECSKRKKATTLLSLDLKKCCDGNEEMAVLQFVVCPNGDIDRYEIIRPEENHQMLFKKGVLECLDLKVNSTNLGWCYIPYHNARSLPLEEIRFTIPLRGCLN